MDRMGKVQKQEEAAQSWQAGQAALTLPNGRPLNPWLVLFSLMFGFFMSLLDATIVNIAISAIQKDLKTDLTTVSWVLNAYNIVFAVLLVTMGRFADQYGRKLMFMIGMILFSIGSLLCALSPSIEWLVGFRALQAIGAAALNPVSLAIITVVFPPSKRGAAIGVWGALAGLAAAVGPVLGGFLVQNYGWRWIFYVNLPFCIVGLYMVYRFVPENKDANASRRVDIPGLLTLSAGMFCLVFAIIQGNDWGWFSSGMLGLYAGAIVGLGAFFFIETRQAHPILDFALFKIRSFSAASAAIFLFSVSIQGAFLIFVLYFTIGQGYDQLSAAYALIPLSAGSFVLSAVTGRFSAKFNPRIVGSIGLSIVALGLFTLSTLSTDSAYLDTMWRGILLGIGLGMVFTTFPTMAVSEVPRPKLGVASGAFNTSRQIGFALGVAILISLFTAQVKQNSIEASSRAVGDVKAAALPQPLKDNITNGLLNSAGQGSLSRDTSSTQNQYDLPSLAERIPDGQSLKPELSRLQKQIGSEFKKGIIDAFRFDWVVAGIIALFGIIPAVLTKGRPPKNAKGEGTLNPVEIGAVGDAAVPTPVNHLPES